MGLPRGHSDKRIHLPMQKTGEVGLFPGLRRSLGGGNGSSLQYSCLENSMDRRAWQDIVHGIAKSWMGLSDRAYMHTHIPTTNLNDKILLF